MAGVARSSGAALTRGSAREALEKGVLESRGRGRTTPTTIGGIVVSLVDLWLPILLSAVLVFVASSVIHMLLHQWHSKDFKRFAAEDAVMDALHPFNLGRATTPQRCPEAWRT
jgi:Flp pilus assembly protein TadB